MCRRWKAYSPTGSRTLREREGERDHDSPQHAVHDTCDGVQSDNQAALPRRCGVSNFGGEADVGTQRGLAAVSWRAGVTYSLRKSYGDAFSGNDSRIREFFSGWKTGSFHR